MKYRRLFSLVACLSLFAACSGGSQSSNEESLREKYLTEVFAVKKDAFVSEQAALLYLRNFCGNSQTGVVSAQDALDEIVASYCSTDLAVEVGVVTTSAPVVSPEFDEESFRKTAIERFGVGIVEEDGSSLDPVLFGRSLCNGDIEKMKSNLGDNFKDSFQEYALTTFCPEKL